MKIFVFIYLSILQVFHPFGVNSCSGGKGIKTGSEYRCEVSRNIRAHCRFNEDSFVDIIETPTGTLFCGSVHGLGENRRHGFHIHENGDLSDGCASCGGHYNPFNKSHGGPGSEERHVGDLGNIDTEDGHAIISIVDLQAQLSGEQSIMNRSIVIHEGEDDLGASGDPSGAAGSRLTCCIIEPVEPPHEFETTTN